MLDTDIARKYVHDRIVAAAQWPLKSTAAAMTLQPTRTPTAAQMPEIDAAASAYLDLLRASAANVVVFSHLFLLFAVPGIRYLSGSLGVVVFFLLSGFLITQSMLKRQHIAGPRFPGFLADRVARIMTPYVPALLLIAIVDALFVRVQLGQSGLSQGPAALLGNLLLLQDHPIFQALDRSGSGMWWRIRSYHSAEPFWTVAIEMWLYVALGVVFFVAVTGERLKRRWLWPLLVISVPVLVWNAAAGGGKSLSLIWLVGAVVGVALPRLAAVRDVSMRRTLAAGMTFAGASALAVHSKKFGFNPYDLQTACLIALILFGPLGWLETVRHVPRLLAAVAKRLAAYSYSLYLVHNTAIAVVLSAVGGVASPLAMATSVVLAHVGGFAIWWLFERHYRRVGLWLRPGFDRAISYEVAPSRANAQRSST